MLSAAPAPDGKDDEPSPEELAAFLSHLRATQQRAAAEAEVVTPQPCFVVKTSLLALPGPGDRPMAPLPQGAAPGQKVFVNITHHAFLPPISTRPGEAGGGGDGESAAAALSVPLAMGEPRLDRDKAGESALAVDVIVHPSVTADAERDASGHFRHWLVEFCLQYFARKFGAALSPQYRVPLMKYKGGVGGGGGAHSQRLRRPKAAVIAEGAGAAEAAAAAAPAKPMTLLAEAGALPEAATGLVLSSPASAAAAAAAAGAASAKPPSLPRGPPKSLAAAGGAGSSPMEIRLVGEERAREAQSFASRVAEEVGKEGGGGAEEGGGGGRGGGAAAPALVTQALSGAPAASSASSGGGIGLSQGSTRRLPRARTVTARVEVEVQAPAEGEAGEGAAGRPVMVACTVAAAAGAPLALAAALPLAHPALRAGSVVAGVAIELALSLPPPPLSALALAGAADGSSLTLRIGAVGDAPGAVLTLALPVPCSLVTLAGSSSGTAGEDGSAVATASARYLRAEGVVVLRLAGALAGAPPPLPSALPPRGDPALAALLARHVECGGVPRYEPDVGSRQWLVAQAWATDAQGGGGGGGGGGGAGAEAAAAAAAAGGGGGAGEALPEDFFHAQDALSMHYVRQREEEQAKKLAKEADKDRERAAEAAAEAQGKAAPAFDAALYTDLL